MRGTLIRKILVILIIVLPAISYSGCKKQKKCGCGKDVLYTLTNQSAYVYFNETGNVMYMMAVGDPYSTYHFCNPVEMFEKVKNYKSGDELLVSGHVYWECNYVYQSSNNSYQTSMYKVYNIQATNVFLDMYGKK
jgi:hypothetical protein